MPRKLRFEFAGACYHVTNRGNYQRAIFEPPGAAAAFFRCLDQACVSYGWRAHAFSILDNHFHLALETPEPNLSEGMQWLQGTWAQRFNRFQEVTGRPFQGRYYAGHAEPGEALARVVDYIHLNPLKAGLERPEQFGEYQWSSLAWFPRRNRPEWLKPSTALACSGGSADTRAGWDAYRQHLVLLARQDPKLQGERFEALTSAWAIGSAAFRAEIRTRLKRAVDRSAPFSLLGADQQAVQMARREVWEDQLRALAAAFAISLEQLPPKKSAKEKLTLAAGMKATTSVSMAWLAQRLQMGATGSVASLLHRFRASGATEQAAYKAILSGFLP